MNTLKFNSYITKFKNNFSTYERMFLRKNEKDLFSFLSSTKLDLNLDSIKQFLKNKKDKLIEFSTFIENRLYYMNLKTKLSKYINTLTESDKNIYSKWEITLNFISFYFHINKKMDLNVLNILFEANKFSIFYSLCVLLDGNTYFNFEKINDKESKINEIQNKIIELYGTTFI